MRSATTHQLQVRGEIGGYLDPMSIWSMRLAILPSYSVMRRGGMSISANQVYALTTTS